MTPEQTEQTERLIAAVERLAAAMERATAGPLAGGITVKHIEYVPYYQPILPQN